MNIWTERLIVVGTVFAAVFGTAALKVLLFGWGPVLP